MASVSQGSLADWSAPRLVATLAGRTFTGELVIESGGRDYRVAWEHGAIVGARSPHPADSAAKIAVALGVLSSTQAGEIIRLMAATPGHDEIEVVAQVARLSTELIGRLARRVAGARASRALSPETGTFTVVDELPFWGTVTPVDARWVLYNGIRTHLTIDRTSRELASLASALRLRDGADITGFGFGAQETIVLERMTGSALSLAPLPAELDAQVACAVALALVLTGEATVAAPPGSVPVIGPPPDPAPALKGTPIRGVPVKSPAAKSQPIPKVPEVKSPPIPKVPEVKPKAPVTPPPVATPPAAAPAAETKPAPASRAPRRGGANADQIRGLVADRLAALAQGVDFFALLDVGRDAAPDEIRSRYFALARHLHPDRLEAAGVIDEKKDAQRLFARMNEAFTTLTDPDKRHRYTEVLKAGGEAAVKAREAATEAAVRKALDAEERFRLGEMALRRQQLEVAVREFQKAVDLNPEESDHHALLGWAIYVAATNKSASVPAARGHLLTAADKNKKSATPHLYLGRIARMENNLAEAERHLQRAHELAPTNAEITAELRAVEGRKPPGKPPDKGGLFSKLTKK